MRTRKVFCLLLGIKFAPPNPLGNLVYAKPFQWTKHILQNLVVLTYPNNIWVKLIKEKYLNKQHFFTCSPKPQDSPILRKILQHRNILHKGIRWKIGDGYQILLWLHNWCSHDSLINMLDIPHDQVDISLRLNNFILPSINWDLKKLASLFAQTYRQGYKRNSHFDEPSSRWTHLGDFIFRRVHNQINQLASP